MPPSTIASGRACIATTVRDPGPALASFLTYHLAIGFEHIYVFFDDPDDRWLGAADAMERVTAIRCDEELLAWQRASAPGWAKLAPFRAKEVMARQLLNVEHALHLAGRRGVAWLLHIDIDELFMAEERAPDHFAAVPDQVGQIIYLNCEAVPEQAETEDYFRAVTLFKRNPRACARGAITRWLAGSGHPWFFLAYENGKAAVRVRPGVRAEDVHLFDVQATGLETISTPDPLILHYVNCDLGCFTRKYQHRGAFSDAYFDRWPRLPFHLHARDVVATGDRAAIAEFYDRHVLCQGEADALIEAGLALRITGPRDLLASRNAAIAAGGAR